MNYLGIDIDINISFKLPLCKKWTILNDRVIHGKKEIFLAEIEDIKASKKTLWALAQIYIIVQGKELVISYNDEQRLDAEITFMHLKENCIRLKNNMDIQTLQEAENRYEKEKIFAKKEEKEKKKQRHEEKQREKLIAQKAREEERERIRAANIKKIYDELNSLNYGNEHELEKTSRELASIISPNEKIKAVLNGIIDWDYYIVVCTNKNIIIKNQKFNNTHIIWMYEVKSISYTHGFFHGELLITHKNDTIRITEIENMKLEFFVKAVNREINLLW